jgi:hypothetical protein
MNQDQTPERFFREGKGYSGKIIGNVTKTINN